MSTNIFEIAEKINKFNFTPKESNDIALCAMYILSNKIEFQHNEINYLQLIKFLMYTRIVLIMDYYKEIFVKNIFHNCHSFLNSYCEYLSNNNYLINIPELFDLINFDDEVIFQNIILYAKNEYFDMFKYVLKTKYHQLKNKNILQYLLAIDNIKLEYLVYIIENDYYDNTFKFINVYHCKNDDFIEYIDSRNLANIDGNNIDTILSFFIIKNKINLIKKYENLLEDKNIIAKICCRYGNQEIFNHYRNENVKYFQHAIKCNNLQFIQYIYNIEKPDITIINKCIRNIICEHNYQSLDFLIECGADKEIILIYAAEFQDEKLTLRMLEDGIDIHTCYDMPLKMCLKSQWDTGYNYLIDDKTDIQDVFYYACENLNYKAMKKLHEKGAKIDQNSLELSIESGNILNILYIYKYGKNNIQINNIDKKYKKYFEEIDRKFK